MHWKYFVCRRKILNKQDKATHLCGINTKNFSRYYLTINLCVLTQIFFELTRYISLTISNCIPSNLSKYYFDIIQMSSLINCSNPSFSRGPRVLIFHLFTSCRGRINVLELIHSESALYLSNYNIILMLLRMKISDTL